MQLDLPGIERKDELLNRPFKRKMDQLKKFLNEKNIKFQVKVVSDDKRLFDMNLLTDIDIAWINDYHKKVYENVSQGLKDKEELAWLKSVTEPIS